MTRIYHQGMALQHVEESPSRHSEPAGGGRSEESLFSWITANGRFPASLGMTNQATLPARAYNIHPPLTFTTCPVTYSASSDAKNATLAATSSTVGGRPIG